VKPLTSEKSTVTTFRARARTGAALAIGAPQFGQNFASSVFGPPQLAQAGMSQVYAEIPLLNRPPRCPQTVPDLIGCATTFGVDAEEFHRIGAGDPVLVAS
jgi:hypothetical protein